MLCSVCHKNMAVIFTKKIDGNNNSEMEGYCYDCAKKKFYLFRNQNYLQALVFDVEALLKGKNYRIKLDLLPKLESFVFPSVNASISSINNSISLQAESGDYRLILAKSDKFENPLVYNILPYFTCWSVILIKHIGNVTFSVIICNCSTV